MASRMMDLPAPVLPVMRKMGAGVLVKASFRSFSKLMSAFSIEAIFLICSSLIFITFVLFLVVAVFVLGDVLHLSLFCCFFFDVGDFNFNLFKDFAEGC